MLSEEITNRFRAALWEHCAHPAGAQGHVSEAVGTAASAARADGMSAAQFVIWVKKIWDQIMDEGGLEHSVDPARERDVVISAAIKAYYVQ